MELVEARDDAAAQPFWRAQQLYVAAVFLFVTGAFGLAIGYLAGGGAGFEDRQGGTPLIQAISLVLYGPSLLFLLVYHATALRTLVRAWPLALLLGIAILSVGWSVEPGVTLRRSVALSLMFGFTLYVAICLPHRRFLSIALAVCAGVLIVSLFSIAIPGVGLEPLGSYAGYVRGIFNEKNTFGRFCGLSLLLLFAYIPALPRGSAWKPPLIALGVVGLALLWAANARTPLVTLLLALAVMWMARFVAFPSTWQQRLDQRLRSILVVAVSAVGIVAVPLTITTAVLLLGRNLTLTGRMKLWQYAIDHGWDRPFLGAGFKAFWTDAVTFDLRERNVYWEIQGKSAINLTANAHNGYLDVWLDLGFLGLAVFLIFLVSYVVKSVRSMRASDSPLSVWPLGLLVFMLSYYVTNSEVLAHSDIGWFFLTYAYLAMAALEVSRARVGRVVTPSVPNRYAALKVSPARMPA